MLKPKNPFEPSSRPLLAAYRGSVSDFAVALVGQWVGHPPQWVVVCDQGRGEIAASMHLIEGCTAQGYNRRKRQWSDGMAVGSRGFAERVRDDPGIRGRYRAIARQGQDHIRHLNDLQTCNP
ncbi:hypothetical protein L6Q96_22465 [Candidatus Binatia bacterium]|nr:hypothetical protein [Candidatus Binatia bacterium]